MHFVDGRFSFENFSLISFLLLFQREVTSILPKFRLNSTIPNYCSLLPFHCTRSFTASLHLVSKWQRSSVHETTWCFTANAKTRRK